MKRNLILYSCIALFIVGCSKNKDSKTNSDNTWNFGGTTYTAANVSYINGGSAANLSATATGATATSADGLVFEFATPPVSDGQMLITSSDDPNTILVAVSKLSGTTTTFYTNDVTSTTANVSVSTGKVSVTFPGKIWLHNMTNFSDSAQLSAGTITQQ